MGNVIILSIFFVIGEFLCNLGEIMIGFLFGSFIPFDKSEKFEKLSPYLKEEQELTYKDFIDTLQQENTITEISEFTTQ